MQTDTMGRPGSLSSLALLLTMAPFLLSPSPVTGPACRQSEFRCDNGICINLNRFCDGTDDCGDASDETVGCTNCNKTLIGDIGIKYPLRISEPFQRNLPFVCTINFMAAGKEHGDIVELTFLSFQIGSLNLGRNQTQICQKGYLKVAESRGNSEALHSQQTRGFSQLISALKKPPTQLSSRYDTVGEAQFGQFCGHMIGRSVVFYSEGVNASLTVSLPSRSSIHSHTFSLYLTYKFLPRAPSWTRFGPDGTQFHLGVRVANTYCDRILVNCDRKPCKVRSPNFPGIYLRNFTCHFLLRQERVPPGHHAQLVVFQQNEYKISVYTGGTNSGTVPRSGLVTDCFSDVIRVYDGSNASSPLLLEFCGAGVLPEIVSSGPELLVQLYSAPFQMLYNSRVEMDVRVRFVDRSEFRLHNGSCDLHIDGRALRHGLVHSPRHTLPLNSTCYIRLTGRSGYDRVWIYFLTYFVKDDHQFSSADSCGVSTLELYDLDGSETSPGEPSFRFCEKTSPVMCTRASDHPDYIPLRPCLYPLESYLSNGSEVLLRYHFYRPPEVSDSAGSSTFTARFEFVDTHQEGLPENGTSCDRRFDSSARKNGTFFSPRSVFLYGRGGSARLSCTYSFDGLPYERVRIRLTSLVLKSDTCDHSYDGVLHRYVCNTTNGTSDRHAFVYVTEYRESNSPVGCLCASADQTIPLQSVSSNIKLLFYISGMTSYEDFGDYAFRGTFEFVTTSLCDSGLYIKNGTSDGELAFYAPPFDDVAMAPLRCRWSLESSPETYFYLKLRGSHASRGCSGDNRIIVYGRGSFEPDAVVCAEGGDSDETERGGDRGGGTVDFFSLSWNNETYHEERFHHRDQVVVEIVAFHAGTFSLRWIEVTKPSLRTQSGRTMRNVNCLFECPELSACINPELWCDGTVHCPYGFDESPENCRRFPTLYLAIGGGVALAVLLITAIVFSRHCRRKKKSKDPRHLPTVEVRMATLHM